MEQLLLSKPSRVLHSGRRQYHLNATEPRTTEAGESLSIHGFTDHYQFQGEERSMYGDGYLIQRRHVGSLVRTTVEDRMMHMKNASTLQFRYEY